MRHGVVGPWIAAIERQRCARDLLGLVEAIALFQPEGMHRMDEAIVRVGGEQRLADLQQGLGVAGIEGVELAELAGQQVARPALDHVFMEGEAARRVAVDPGGSAGEPGALAIVEGAGHRPGARQVAARGIATFAGLHGQGEVGRHQRQQGTGFFRVGDGDKLGQPVAEGQPFVSQEIEGV